MSAMNERHFRFFILLSSFALVGALLGYLRDGSLSGMLAGAFFLVVISGVVGLLMTDARSPAN